LDSYFNARDEAYQKFTRERQTLWNRIAAKEAKRFAGALITTTG